LSRLRIIFAVIVKIFIPFFTSFYSFFLVFRLSQELNQPQSRLISEVAPTLQRGRSTTATRRQRKAQETLAHHAEGVSRGRHCSHMFDSQ
jgi:hypothetical protein